MNLLMLSGDVVTAQGTTGVFAETLRLLSPHWSRIDVVCPRTFGSMERVVHGNALVHPVGRRRALHAVPAARKGAALIAERPYHLIVSHDYSVFANGLAAWWLSRRHGIPYVSEMHGVEGYPVAASRRDAVYRRLAGAYARFAGRHAAAVRTVNGTEIPAFLLQHGVPRSKILVLPALYLDLDVLVPDPAAPRTWDVLCVGRLVETKNFGLVIDAIDLCRRRGRTVRLCILGDGPLAGQLRRRISALGLEDRVAMIPAVEGVAAMARLYRSTAILVCSSSSEGGPRVTVEAMACGIPVVTTPVGIMRQLVRDGENAILVERRVDALAATILRLLDDDGLRRRLGDAGRRSVEQFGAEKVIDELVERYRAIASGGTSLP